MTHIFISYSKKDTRELAFALSDALNALPNITAWVDRSLKAGPSWETQIQTEIRKCDYFVVLYSPDINRHLNGEEESYVLTEISYAKYTLKKPIIPIMVQKTEPPISLTRAHYIDYTLPGLALADLIDAISVEIGIHSSPVLTPQSLPENHPPVQPITAVKAKPHSIDLLPQPFAWVDIPGGKVEMIQGILYTVTQFKIAKYPVTNAQFRLFMDAGGYRENKWWTEVGWQWCKENKWKEPRYWNDVEWNSAEQPVVGVSWFEALAFCLWLSDTTGENITLPTEDQWQYAAQGKDGRDYPWGSKWDRSRCNNSVYRKGIGKTTPVRHYEGQGDSPFGVVDMAGNVWEWCLTLYYDTGLHIIDEADVIVLHGGSWVNFDSSFFRCLYRYGDSPTDRTPDIGFRLVIS